MKVPFSSYGSVCYFGSFEGAFYNDHLIIIIDSFVLRNFELTAMFDDVA